MYQRVTNNTLTTNTTTDRVVKTRNETKREKCLRKTEPLATNNDSAELRHGLYGLQPRGLHWLRGPPEIKLLYANLLMFWRNLLPRNYAKQIFEI